MDKPVIIFGVSPITVAAIEIFKSNGIDIFGILEDDKNTHGTEISDIPVLSKTNDDGYLKYIGKKCEAFIAYDDVKLRKSIAKMIIDKRKVMPMNAIHERSYVSHNAHIGHGNFLNMGCLIGAGSEIGHHVLVNAHATIDHSSKIDDHCIIGTGATVGSNVSIGENSFIGTGATIVSGITIGKNARIGAGSVVIAHVGDNETVFGNPAQKVDQ